MVTADLLFLARLQEACVASGWRVQHALSVDEAALRVRLEGIRMVIYDAETPGLPWQQALPFLGDTCILLGSPVMDEFLWQDVVRCGGYDVIATSATPEQMVRTLRFAWSWTLRRKLPLLSQESKGG